MRESAVISNFRKEEKDNQELDTLEEIICITLPHIYLSRKYYASKQDKKTTGSCDPSPRNSMAEPSRMKKVNCMTYQRCSLVTTCFYCPDSYD